MTTVFNNVGADLRVGPRRNEAHNFPEPGQTRRSAPTLKEPGLVDRGKIALLLEHVMGKTGAEVALRGLENFYVQAEVMRAGDEKGERE
jgi:hypothetical protein